MPNCFVCKKLGNKLFLICNLTIHWITLRTFEEHLKAMELCQTCDLALCQQLSLFISWFGKLWG